MLYIDKKDKTPLYEQLYNSIIREIANAGLEMGSRLPATRKLAAELNIGRNTVDKAYQQLVLEGYIQPKIGSGFVVNWVPEVKSVSQMEDVRVKKSRENSLESKIVYDFSYGAIDNELFPYTQWRKSMNNTLTVLENGGQLDYSNKTGEPELKEEIAIYLKRARDVNCTPEQIIITSGQQYSMEILANMFMDEKTFAMEEPGYDGTRQIFANHQYKLMGIPVNDNGIVIECLNQINAKLLCVTPSHQFPTGGVMPVGNRYKLIEWAEENDSFIIEDDYDSELRYYTNPVPSLQSMDVNGRVIYTGSFSKSLAPSMRIAYMVMPMELMNRYNDFYHRYHSQVDKIHQLTLADFMKSGHYERHINKLRTYFRKKQEAMIAAINKVFGESVVAYGEGAGIHLILDINTDLDQEELLSKAITRRIRLYSTKPLYMEQSNIPKHQLLMGLPIVPEDKFEDILVQLKEAWGIN